MSDPDLSRRVEKLENVVEPLAFTAGVFYDEATGTLVMSGTLIGYEE